MGTAHTQQGKEIAFLNVRRLRAFLMTKPQIAFVQNNKIPTQLQLLCMV